MRSVGVGLALAALLAFGCATHARWQGVLADPEGGDLAALVDSERARLLLAEILQRGPVGANFVAQAQAALPGEPGSAGSDASAGDGGLPDAARLLELGQEVSVDFAALTFARAIGADPTSRTVQAVFDRFLHDSPDRAEEALREHEGFPYTVLFAPAWSYRSNRASGADFARQRRLLDRLGIDNRLVATDESGAVEDNASTIAAAVREASRGRRRVIVVSASKSSAEVALALARVATDESAGVAGWLNVAGALRGSPLADAALRPPASWIMRLVFWLADWSWAGVTSMATSASRARLVTAQLPASIAVVNLVAVTVSGTVGSRVFFGYQILREHGPNDGVVLLADTVWPGGANLVALGADHLFSSRQWDAHDVALLRAVDFAVRRHRSQRRQLTNEGAGVVAPVAAD